MKAIVIGAGRGRRLMPLTEEVPKCYAPVAGRRILDWSLAALRAGGCHDVVFIGGYLIEKIRADYPALRFCHNAGWPDNNILVSLFQAEAEMASGFVSSYADILYTGEAVGQLVAAPGDVALLVDTDWRERYRPRTEHPETDGEKVRLRDGRVTEVSRTIPPAEAPAEFTGVARFSPAGARALVEHYHRARRAHDGRPYRRGQPFARAYLIDLLQDMLEAGVEMRAVTTHGAYFEIDTTQDWELAGRGWPPAAR
ncbi:MAG TPA: NTP transferase domain-containing protein [Vicinamibacteria bacterium]|nr:NTP transferase domain-containing protein [Vicinamibacteria bacterium]